MTAPAAISRDLSAALTTLASLVDEAARLAGVAAPDMASLRAVADRTRPAADALAAARQSLQSLAEPGLTDAADPHATRRAVACSVAAIELEPACRALRDIPLAAARAAAPAVAARAVHLFLSIGHRQCLAACHALAGAATRSDR